MQRAVRLLPARVPIPGCDGSPLRPRLHLRGHRDIRVAPDPELAGLVEPEAPERAVLVNPTRMLLPGRDRRERGSVHGARLGEIPRLVHPALPFVVGTPAPQRTSLPQPTGVILARRHDFPVREGADALRRQYVGTTAIADLAGPVRPPTPQRAVVGDGACVVIARGHEAEALAHCHAHGLESVRPLPLRPLSDLAEAVPAPAPQTPVLAACDRARCMLRAAQG